MAREPDRDKGNLLLPPRRVGCREVAQPQPRLLLLALPLSGCHGNTGLVLPSDIKMLLPAERAGAIAAIAVGGK